MGAPQVVLRLGLLVLEGWAASPRGADRLGPAGLLGRVRGCSPHSSGGGVEERRVGPSTSRPPGLSWPITAGLMTMAGDARLISMCSSPSACRSCCSRRLCTFVSEACVGWRWDGHSMVLLGGVDNADPSAAWERNSSDGLKLWGQFQLPLSTRTTCPIGTCQPRGADNSVALGSPPSGRCSAGLRDGGPIPSPDQPSNRCVVLGARGARQGHRARKSTRLDSPGSARHGVGSPNRDPSALERASRGWRRAPGAGAVRSVGLRPAQAGDRVGCGSSPRRSPRPARPGSGAAPWPRSRCSSSACLRP